MSNELKVAREEARQHALNNRSGFQEFNLKAIEEPVEPKIKPKPKKKVSKSAKEKLYVDKYGPGTKYNRDIIKKSIRFDADQKKWYVTIICSHEECNERREVASSDLFQVRYCNAHQQEKARQTQNKKNGNKNDKLDKLVSKRKSEIALRRAESARRAKRKG